MAALGDSAARASCDNAQIDGAYASGGTIYYIRGTTAYNYTGGVWGAVNLNSASLWAQPNAPFYNGDTRRIDTIYSLGTQATIIRGTTAFVYDSGTWLQPIDLAAPSSIWASPGAPFEGGDTRPLDASYSYGNLITVYRGTKAYLYEISTAHWLTPVELNSSVSWRVANAPFQYDSSPIDAAYASGDVVTILRNTVSQRQAYLWDNVRSVWLTPYMNLEGFWNAPNAPYPGGRVFISCSPAVGGMGGYVPPVVTNISVGSASGGAIPATPSDVTASGVTANSVTLQWKDNSADETGFRVYKDGVPMASTAANVTTVTVTGLQASNGYCFKVYSVRGTTLSNASTQACAVTVSNGPTGKVEVNLLRKADDFTPCGSTTAVLSGQTKTATGVWTGYNHVGNCIYPFSWDKIAIGKQTISAPDAQACGFAYVDVGVTWFMRLDWFQNRCM